MRKIFIMIIILCFSFNAYGDQEVTAIMKNEIAPYNGLLIKEKKFIKLLESELSLKETQKLLIIEKKYNILTEKIYKKHLYEATKPIKWYQTPTFNRVLGFTLGVLTTISCVYLGTQIVKASNK